MATVYKIELVSHWINYPENEIEDKIKKALLEHNNVLNIRVEKLYY